MKAPKRIAHAVWRRLTLRANRGPIGIGLIGVGGWGAANAEYIMRSRMFNICGVYDTQPETARRFAQHFNTKQCRSVDELLADPSTQAVCITVPNHHHMRLAKLAADAGKHIFIEKPLASHPDDCEAIGRYCDERRVVLQVGHQMRREPVFRRIKQIIEDGVLGAPLFVQCVYTLQRCHRIDWRQNANACPAGSMEQLGVHVLDVLAHLFGSPLHCQGWAHNVPLCMGQPDWAGVILTFSEGVRASVCTSFSCPGSLQMAYYLSKGRITTDGRTLCILSDNGMRKHLRPPGVIGGISQFVEFAQCIQHGTKPETGASEAAVVMTMVQAIFSTEEGAVT